MVSNGMLAAERFLTLDRHIAQHWNSDAEIDLQMADRVESASLAWSPKIKLDNIGSLLALGNKAGHITLWHVVGPNNVRCVKSWKAASDNWITHLSWSPWMVEDNTYVSTLAYATANGVVHACKVKFQSSDPLQDIEVSDNLMDPNQSLHPCTILRWSPGNTENADMPNMLAFSKGNRLHVWLPESSKVLTWRRPIAKAVADIVWDAHGRKIFAFFMDGKHVVLHRHGAELSVDDDSVEFIYQTIISRCHVQSKTNVTQEEGDGDNANGEDDGAGDEEGGGGLPNSKLQLHVNSGNHSAYASQLATLYYVTSPFHMEFQRERYQSFLTRNPAYHLWDLLLLLSDRFSSNENGYLLLQQLFQVLDMDTSTPSSSIVTIVKRETIPSRDISTVSRLESAFFKDYTADRVTVYLWNQLQNCHLPVEVRDQVEHRASASSSRLRKHCTRSILKIFVETTGGNKEGTGAEMDMPEHDGTLLLLLCDSVLLFHHDDKELLTLAERTYGLLKKLMQDQCDTKEQMDLLHSIKQGGSLPAHKPFSSGRERCPACDGEVKLESETSATCLNGHSWKRCSITLLLIADFHPRTCLGCSRKTLMVPNPRGSNGNSNSSSNSGSWLEMTLRGRSLITTSLSVKTYTSFSFKRMSESAAPVSVAEAGLGPSAPAAAPESVAAATTTTTNNTDTNTTARRPKKVKKLNKKDIDEVLMHDIVELRGHNHWDWDPKTPAPFQNFEELEVTIGSLAQSGEGLALLPDRGDGWVVAVPFVVPGEKVIARVYRHNWGYSHADLVKVIQPAENRIAKDDILCKYFGTCGGCQLQHISYADQMKFKRQVVENAFKNYAAKYFASLPPVDPVAQSPLQSQYRTKITPHFEALHPKHRAAGVVTEPVPIGFLYAGKRKILDIEDCPIATPILNEGLKIMRAEVQKTIASYKKGATMLLRESNPVVAGTESEDPPKTTKICVTDHKASITEWVGKFRFDYPAGSFFQNNNAILPSLIGY
ncbi:tRNA(m5U54)methyltransferase, partial [Dissophora globulifera]